MICFAIVPAAMALWQVASESARQDLGHGVWQVARSAKGRSELELTIVFFDSSKIKIAVVAQSVPTRDKARTLAELAQESGALAACNGGYFTPEFGPSGLEIAHGVRAGRWRDSGPHGGVLHVQQSAPALESNDKFRDTAAITDLVECSPVLVEDGVAQLGFKGVDRVARTFVATDGGSRWAIGFCLRATLDELASALASQTVVREFAVKTALNLDGGPSSGLWWKPIHSEPQGIRPKTRVRNVVMILPKP